MESENLSKSNKQIEREKLDVRLAAGRISPEEYEERLRRMRHKGVASKKRPSTEGMRTWELAMYNASIADPNFSGEDYLRRQLGAGAITQEEHDHRLDRVRRRGIAKPKAAHGTAAEAEEWAPEESDEDLAWRGIEKQGYCEAGKYPWDFWKARALERGVAKELATLGRSLMREAYNHDWPEKLKAECGWKDRGEAMILMALAAPTMAQKAWEGTMGMEERGEIF